MATQDHAASTAPTRDRLTVDRYVRLIAEGRWADDAHVELLDGRAGRADDQEPGHTTIPLGRSALLLRGMLPAEWVVSEEKSLVLGRSGRPEPDLAVIRGPNTLYRARDPKGGRRRPSGRGGRVVLRLRSGREMAGLCGGPDPGVLDR